MFENTLVLDTGNRRPWTILAGLTGQLAALGIAVLLPLVYTDSLPSFRLLDFHILPPVGRPAPPPQEMQAAQQRSPSRPDFVPPSSLTVPVRIPDHPQIIIDAPPAPVAYNGPSVEGGIPYSGTAGSTGIPNAIASVPPPPPAETKVRAAEQAKPAEPVKQLVPVGGDVQAAKLINKVIPAYPALAKQARISGTVKLLGVVGKDGTVQQLRVLSGHPLLVPAAVEAVRQWLYRPTLLNGQPVEVIAPIDVHFTLVQ